MAFELNNSGPRRSRLIGMAVACVVLHLALAPQLRPFGGTFNFMLVLTVSMAISMDSRSMVYIGFFCGLLYDLTTTGPVGLMSLLLALVGYGVAMVSRGLASGVGMETLRVVIAAVLGVNLVYSIAMSLLGVESSLLISIGVHGLASTALDVLAGVPFLLLAGGSVSQRGFSARGVYGRGSRFKGMR